LKSVKSKVVPVEDRNPFYLRGDFDGDGNSDLALVVRSVEGDKKGILICAGSRKPLLLGITGDRQFSDMPHDRFIAPNWEVLTRTEVKRLGQFKANVPNPVPSPRGESIAMIWEDGIALIYWDGHQFRWAGVKR
jgi:hypothetical protein